MNVYLAILNFWHRLLGATTQELTALKREVEFTYDELKARLNALEVSAKNDLYTLRKEAEERERYVFALESRLTTELASHLKAMRYLHCTKRDSAGLRGDTPEALK